MQEETNEFKEGWYDGYKDTPYHNPYFSGTIEYEDYDKGYEDGSRDC